MLNDFNCLNAAEKVGQAKITNFIDTVKQTFMCLKQKLFIEG